MQSTDRTNMPTLGAIIKKARLEKGWTQEELSDKSQVGARHIMAIENDKRNPGIETFKNLITALNLSADDVLFPQTQLSMTNRKNTIIRILDDCNENKQKIALVLIEALANMENV